MLVEIFFRKTLSSKFFFAIFFPEIFFAIFFENFFRIFFGNRKKNLKKKVSKKNFFQKKFNQSQPTSTHLIKTKPTSPIYRPLFTNETNRPLVFLGKGGVMGSIDRV